MGGKGEGAQAQTLRASRKSHINQLFKVYAHTLLNEFKRSQLPYLRETLPLLDTMLVK